MILTGDSDLCIRTGGQNVSVRQNEIMKISRLKLIVIFAIAILAGGSAFLLARVPSSIPVSVADPTVPLQPKVTWSTSSTSVTLSPGESTSEDISFSSSGALGSLAIEAVPEIARFVSIQPSAVASMTAGQQESAHLSFLIPAATALGTYTGTIHIRNGERTLPQTLKVTINVWHTFTDGTLGFKLHYPPTWVLSEDSSSQQSFFSSSATDALANGDAVTPPDITFDVLDNSAGASLQQFVAGYQNGWFGRYGQLSNVNIGGHAALVADDSSDPIPRVPQLAIFIVIDTKILFITGHSIPDTNAIVGTLQLP